MKHPIGEGSLVHYHPIIGQPHDGKVYRVRAIQTQAGTRGPDRTVAFIEGKRGFVAIEALSVVRTAEARPS